MPDDSPQQPDAHDPDEPDPPPSGVAIDITCDAAETDDTAAKLEQTLADLLRRACDLLHHSQAQLSVVIIDDHAMTTLHDQFMQIPETTDVLTFDLRSDPSAAIEGEIYVCLDEARRRATELGHPYQHELQLYALHGLLHLVGYDDHTDADWREMHAEEDRLLERLGVGRVFDVDGGGTSR